MAIYHLRAKIISRGAGKSAVAAAAYRSASELEDKKQNLIFDYSHKHGVEYSAILAPEHAPEWVKDRAKLWNEVEASEKRINSQVAREIEIAIPVELTKSQKIELVKEFVLNQFVSQGMVADINIHLDNPENPHAHILLTTREISLDGFTTKNRSWNQKENLLLWREKWAESANNYLRAAGYEIAIDHRSYKDQGIEVTPTFHLGYKLYGMLKTGGISDYDRLKEYQEIASKNAEKIINEPSIALTALTKQQSVFTEIDIAKFANRNSNDTEQYNQVVAAIKNSSQIIAIAQTDAGRTIYTTREMIEIEASLVQNALSLSEKNNHLVNDKYKTQALQDNQNIVLNEGQLRALEHVLSARDLNVIIGFAGTGKSTMMNIAKNAWEAQGYRVLGTALSGIAAQNLQDSGIQSRTIDSLMMSLDKSIVLTSKDIIVVDEAGMVDSAKLSKLLFKVEAANAKMVLIGDPEQLQPIQAGAPFRVIAERTDYIELDEIVRQKNPLSEEITEEMRQASKEFATQKTIDALERYARMGKIYVHTTRDDAIDAVISAWDKARKPGITQIILAYTRKDIAAINTKVRALLQQQGVLKNEQKLLVKNRDDEEFHKSFAVRDRIYFIKNDKDLGVKNGSLGRITSMCGNTLSVLLDNGNTITFSLHDYSYIDYGYAATIHKSQGVTIDNAYLLADKYLDRHSSYVAATRHRKSLEIHYDTETFVNQEALYSVLSKEKRKDMISDYIEVRGFEFQEELALPTQTQKTAQVFDIPAVLADYVKALREFEKATMDRLQNLGTPEANTYSEIAKNAAANYHKAVLAIFNNKDLWEKLCQGKSNNFSPSNSGELSDLQNLESRLRQGNMTQNELTAIVSNINSTANSLSQTRGRGRNK